MPSTYERKVVVGVDGSDDSLAAVDLAAAEAVRRKLPLLLVSASPTAGRIEPQLTLTGFLRRVTTTWPGLPATARNLTGDPATALVAASRTAALVLVGRSGNGRGAGPGSTCLSVAAHSLCPTLVVPTTVSPVSGLPGQPAPAQIPVLLGLSITPDDEPAIEFAFEEASLRQTPLLAAHVWSGIPATAVGAVNPFAYDLAKAQATAERLIAENLAGWSEKYPDVQVDRMPLYDVNPARTLLEASALAGMVVVGARRGQGRSSQLLGTVARTLIQRARCPVAVLRATHRS